MDTFSVLIVDPDSASRGKLKQAAVVQTSFHQVVAVSLLSEATSHVESRQKVDLVFLSSRFPHDDICAFIALCKHLPTAEDAAFVVLLRSGDNSSASIAHHMVEGIDGFVCEPFSAENLRETAELTARVKKANIEKRARAALTTLLREVMERLDTISALKALGRDITGARGRFAQNAATLQRLGRQHPDIYQELAQELFPKASPRALPKYSGASERVRRRQEQRALEKVQSESEED